LILIEGILGQRRQGKSSTGRAEQQVAKNFPGKPPVFLKNGFGRMAIIFQ